MDAGPALVSILRQGDYLIASIHTALDDSQMVRFQHDLIDQIGQHRSRGVIIDVAALDVIDSFGTLDAAQHRRDGAAAWCPDGDRRASSPTSRSPWSSSAWTPARSRPPWIWRKGCTAWSAGRPTCPPEPLCGALERDRARTAAAQLPNCLPALPAEPGRSRPPPRVPDRSCSHDRWAQPARSGPSASPGPHRGVAHGPRPRRRHSGRLPLPTSCSKYWPPMSSLDGASSTSPPTSRPTD